MAHGAPSFECIVIGDGLGGDLVARTLGREGRKVALVERHDLGGECLNWGCVPSKALIHVARRSPYLPWAEVRDRLTAIRNAIRGDESDGGFAADGVTLIRGEARIEPGGVVVDGARYSAKDVVIATGSSPALPPVPGLAETRPLTNRTLFSLQRFPARLAVVGGGPVGLELGQAMRLLGAQVTIYEAETIASTEDRDIADALRGQFFADEIEIREGARIAWVKRENGHFAVAAGESVEVFDEVLVAAGRTPNVPAGFVESGGELAEGGTIAASACGETAAAGIWAIGDVSGGPAFTHNATFQAHHVAKHLVEGRCPGLSPEMSVPWAIFTTPEVGHVGLTEAEAREKHGGGIRAACMSASRIDWFRMNNEPRGFAKVVVDDASGRLLGAHFFCAQASTLAGEAALAVQHGLTARQVAGTIHPYPTASEIFRWACARAVD